MISPESIKWSVASYFRYTRQCPLIAFEADSQLDSYKDSQADILVVDKKRLLTEIEVKVSIADLRRDRSKKKHWHFKRGDRRYPIHNFYFAVPNDIANKACLVCDELYTYAGIIGSDGLGDYGVSIYRCAKALSYERLSFKKLLIMIREQSGTLCRLSGKVVDLERMLKSEVDK